MTEALELFHATRELTRASEPFVTATVVRVIGSSYRRPGARMLVTREGGVAAGSVSGGCLEGDIAKRAFFKTDAEPVVLARYDLRVDEDIGWGLGCNGVVDVLLERGGEGRGPAACIARAIEKQRPAARAVSFEGDGVGRGASLEMTDDGEVAVSSFPRDMAPAVADALRSALHDGETRAVSVLGVDVLLDVVVPPPCLFVFGTSHDALPLVTLGKGLGWEVSVCDVAPRWSTRERFRFADTVRIGRAADLAAAVDGCYRAAAVVLSHDYARDRAYLQALFGSRAEYIGVLGPRMRTQRMLDDLAAEGWSAPPSALARLHAPVGLDLEANTPAEIALAIAAEIQACMAGASATRLRDKVGPIHLRRACA